MLAILWILESLYNPRFPDLLTIRRGKMDLLCFRVQDRWPGQKGHVFCVREGAVAAQ